MQFRETALWDLLQQIGSCLDITYAFIKNSLSVNHEKQISALFHSVVTVASMASGTARHSQRRQWNLARY